MSQYQDITKTTESPASTSLPSHTSTHSLATVVHPVVEEEHGGEEANHIRFIEEKTLTNPPDRLTTHVLIEILLNAVEDIDSVTQSAYVDFNINCYWKDTEVEGRLWDDIEWDKVWKPHISILNSIDVEATLEDKNYWTNMNFHPHGIVSYWQRYKGRIKTPLDLKKFPFDTQTLKIQLSSTIWTIRDSVFYNMTPVTALRDMTKSLKFVEWDVVEDLAIETTPADAEGSPTFTVSLTITRQVGYYFSKIMSIVAMLVLMVLVVFFITADTLNDRAGLIFTLFLATVAFHFLIADILPRVSYITNMDLIMVAGYLLQFLAVIQCVVASILWRSRGESVANHFDLICGIVYFGLFLITVTIIFFLSRAAHVRRTKRLLQLHEPEREGNNVFNPYQPEPLTLAVEKALNAKKEVEELTSKAMSSGTKDKGKGSDASDGAAQDGGDEDDVTQKKRDASIILLPAAQINMDGIQKIVGALQGNLFITTIDLSFNTSIRDDGAIALATALTGNTAMRTLYLKESGVGSSGAIALCGDKVAPGLLKLDLSQNKIGDSAGPAIGQMIKINRPLVTLCLGSNKLTSEGVKPIAEGLTTNTKLHFLQLNYQQIGNKGAKAFKSALEVNYALITLHLGENKVAKVLLDKIRAILAQDERQAKRIDSVVEDDDDDD